MSSTQGSAMISPNSFCEFAFTRAIDTSSTAQGGGGSFKNRKPIGEAGCCESQMAERSHWWTERWLRVSSLSLSFFLFSDYLCIYLSIYLSIHLSIYLSIYRACYFVCFGEKSKSVFCVCVYNKLVKQCKTHILYRCFTQIQLLNSVIQRVDCIRFATFVYLAHLWEWGQCMVAAIGGRARA